MTESGRITADWLSWPQTQKLVQAFADKPGALRFVGGAVRDSVLGHSAQDVDAATTCLPEETMAILEAAGIKAVPTGLAHGTVTAVIDGRHFEITTLRSDIACDGRHAQVVYTDNWQQDAQRRDFTINALYLSPQGELFDYFDGLADARAGHVRFIGSPEQRISEDRLRILRFFRFYARFGKGSMDSAALGACKLAAHEIGQLSGERILKELLALLALPNASATILVMQEEGILEQALGFESTAARSLARLEQLERLTGKTVPAHLKLNLFIYGQADAASALASLASRLRLSNNMLHDLEVMERYSAQFTTALPLPRQKQLIRRMGSALFAVWVLLGWALGEEVTDSTHPCHAMVTFADSWALPVFPVGGSDLVAAGMSQGKELGMALQRLEEAWEASDYRLGKDALLAML
jgi:poly(A) polymerase